VEHPEGRGDRAGHQVIQDLGEPKLFRHVEQLFAASS
jgi:hypothetical protein